MSELVPSDGITGNVASVDRLRELEKLAAQRTGTSFSDLLTGDVDVMTGRQVALKENLLYVPFAITHARFNPGKGGRDYVSLEITTQDDQALVLNDSGTGIRRQVVAYLAAKGTIELPAGIVKIKSEDGKSSTELEPVDAPYWTWQSSDKKNADDLSHDPGYSLRWVILHGLRVSHYTNEHGENDTFYLS